MKHFQYHLKIIICLLCLLITAAIGYRIISGRSPNIVREIQIISSSWGAAYTLQINGEPVSYSDGAETSLFIGYPIHGATNQYLITVRFPSTFQMPMNMPPRIAMHILTREGATRALDRTSWGVEDDILESWNVDDEYSYDSDFVMEKAGVDKEFDLLGTNIDTYIAQCKLMSNKLADCIRRQDCNKLAAVFGLSAGSFATNYARLIRPTNVFEIESVPDSTKLSAITGDHLVLIHPMLGWHLVSFTSRKARENWFHNQWAAVKHEGAHYFDSFVFGKLGGRWECAINGCGWREMNVDRLME
jgi:hypothetical protein